MDAIVRLKRINNKGIAIVYLALMIVVLVAFVGLAVDIGYMYIAKGQLQNAADSAALAGAAKLPQDSISPNTVVRSEAKKFAEKNIVVPSITQVQVASDGTNSLSNSNDIIIGRWDRTSGFRDGVTPFNAVKARARRSTDSPGGPVNLFFARVMGWETMNTSATAVAAMIAEATTYFSVCQNFCSVAPTDGTEYILDPARVLVTGTAESAPATETPFENLFAWSSLTEKPTGPGFSLNDIICSNSPNTETCGYPIYTTMGGDTTTMRKMESVMYNPTIDVANKDKDADGNVIVPVTGWNVTIPVTETCPPGVQGIGVGLDPHPVWGYVTIHIKAICVPGGGQGCSGSTGYSAPTSVCSSYPGQKVIIIDKIACTSCANSGALEGLKPKLVE